MISNGTIMQRTCLSSILRFLILADKQRIVNSLFSILHRVEDRVRLRFFELNSMLSLVEYASMVKNHLG